MKIYADGSCAVARAEVADSFGTRFLGLMGRKELPPDGGLLLKRCGSIHTCFMRFTIDVIYLSADLTVITQETIQPWKLGKAVKGAKHVLELPEGAGSAFPQGCTVILREE